MIIVQSLNLGLLVIRRPVDWRNSYCSSFIAVTIATSTPLALCYFSRETSLLFVTRYNLGEEMTIDRFAMAISFAKDLKKDVPLKI